GRRRRARLRSSTTSSTTSNRSERRRLRTPEGRPRPRRGARSRRPRGAKRRGVVLGGGFFPGFASPERWALPPHPLFGPRTEMIGPKSSRSWSEQLRPRRQDLLHPFVREPGPVRAQEPDHPFLVDQLERPETTLASAPDGPGLEEPSEVDGESTGAQPGPGRQVRN